MKRYNVIIIIALFILLVNCISNKDKTELKTVNAVVDFTGKLPNYDKEINLSDEIKKHIREGNNIICLYKLRK